MAKPRSEWGDALLVRAVNKHMSGQLFHLADEANALSINRHGVLSKSEAKSRGVVPRLAGGNDLTRSLDRDRGLEDFVFLAFTKSVLMPKDEATTRYRRPLLLHISPEILFVPGVKVGLGRGNGAMRFDAMAAVYNMDWEILLKPELRTSYGGPARWNNFLVYEILVPKCVPRSYIVSSE